MKFLIYIILISSSLNQYSLYIKNIYILNKESYIDNNFQLFLDIISGEVIPNNLKINNMFDIKLHSDNLNEQNIFITFKCDLYGPTNITDLHIKCILKDKIPENINGPFYFTKNHFDKRKALKVWVYSFPPLSSSQITIERVSDIETISKW